MAYEYEAMQEELRSTSNRLEAAKLLLKDLLRPNETLAAAVERAQLFIDAEEKASDPARADL